MYLFLICGPPASGKSTVAAALADLLRLRVVANHDTGNLAARLFPFGTDEYRALNAALRILTLERAVAAGLTGVIYTYAYRHANTQSIMPFLKRAADLGVTPRCVHLQCSSEELERRVVEKSRAGASTEKITQVAVLRRCLTEADYTTPLPGAFVISTEVMPPDMVARAIAAHFANRED